MSSNLHPINGGRVLAPVRFISEPDLLKRQFLRLLFVALIVFWGMGGSVWGQTYTDNASSYGGSWTNGSNNSSPAGGFGSWTISAGLNSGVFIGSPAGDGMGTTGIGTAAFAMYATGSAYCNASRGITGGMQRGDVLTFYWAMNFDAGGGSKGFELKNGTTTLFIVNNTGDATISTTNGNASTAYGTTPMLVTITRTSSSSYSFSMTARNGGATYNTTINSSLSINAINFYIGNQNDGAGQKNIYINAFSLVKPDQYQSKGSGVWSSANNWQISSNGGATWSDAGTAPISIAYNTATIRSGHSITLDADATVGNLKIDGTLNWSGANTLTVAESGILTNNGTVNSGSGTVNFAGAGTVTGASTITFNNLTINNGTLTLSTVPTIDGTLRINGGSVSAAPIYTANSTLQYNVNYTRFNEWNATSGTIGTTPGYPNHVTINTGTFTVVNNDAGTARAINGTLTVQSGATFSTGTLNALMTVVGDINNYGTINMSASTGRIKCNDFYNYGGASCTLSSSGGGDLEITGDLVDNATFNANTRAVFFTGNTDQNISGSGTFNIDYIVSDKSGGRIIMGNNLLCEGPNGGNAMTLTNTDDILDLNGFILTIGKSNVASGFSGNGYIRGSTTSDISILGTGSFGQLRMDPSSSGTTNALETLTISRTSSGAVTLGTALNIFDQLNVTAGTLTTSGNLTLKSTTSNTARVTAIGATGSVSGDVYVERYFTRDKRAWRMVTAPVIGNTNNSIFYNWQNNGTNGSGVEIWGPAGTGAAGNGLAVGPNASMRYWNNSTNAFENVTNTREVNLPAPLFSASGNPLSYFLFVSGAYGSGNIPSGTPGASGVTIKAVGSLRQGNQTFSIPSAVGNQFYMVGNPYASPVNLGSTGVAMTNVNNSIWLWDPNLSGAYGVGGYVSFNRTLNEYNITGSYLNSPEYTRLQSGQAFFVQATANGALSVNFTESTKGGNDNGNVFRNTNEFVSEKLRVTLQRDFSTDYITTDGAVAVFHAGGTKEIDEMDGVKMMNAANNLMFRRNGTNLTFEHRPLVQDDDTLFLNLRSTSAGAYRLLLQGSDFDHSRHLEAFLQDIYLEREVALPLDTTVSYEFAIDANATSSGERFRIVFRKKAIPPPVEIGTDFSVYPNPVRSGENLSLKFRNREAGKYTVAIYNMQGIQVQQQVLLHGGSSSVHNIALNAGLPAGTYLVQVLDGSAKKIDAIKINVQ